ncbi:MAG TPA: cytochrome c oxidase assembly protein [Methylomirabilota bacterium]|nr:cytochrome c oxidase assembly protein [Methylomirabilota bacterium]
MAHAVPGAAGPPPLGPGGFDWTAWHADPTVVAGLALLGAAYAVAGWRRRGAVDGAVPARQVVSFYTGLVVLFGALTGPLHDLSDYYLFSAHMVQHLLLAFAMPPLLLYGTPGWMLDALVRMPLLMRLGRLLTRPSGAFAAFNLVLVGWHLPPLYNVAMEHHGIHIVQHLMIMVVSVLLWWPLLSPMPDLPRAPYPVQLLYLFVVGLPMVVVSIFIAMADSVLYPYYAAAPRVWPALSAHDDQHLGGLIMWVPGGLVFLAAISVVFFRWQAAGADDVALPEAQTHRGR